MYPDPIGIEAPGPPECGSYAGGAAGGGAEGAAEDGAEHGGFATGCDAQDPQIGFPSGQHRCAFPLGQRVVIEMPLNVVPIVCRNPEFGRDLSHSFPLHVDVIAQLLQGVPRINT